MDNFLLLFSFLLSSFLIYIFQYFFLSKKKFDEVNHRSSHTETATRSGGISIFLTLFIIAVLYYFNEIELFDYSLFIPLGILFLLGLYDDLYLVDFKIKFLMQIIIAKILIDQGFVITSFLGVFEIPWVLAQIITVIFFVTLVNAYNFIDGIDGLAITETVKNLLFFVILLPSENKLNLFSKILICIILPLYYFNYKKSKKVFLGDAGSLLLGGVNVIMALQLLSANSITSVSPTKKILIVLALVLYPLFDLIRVITIRLKNNKSPFEADKNHIHHWFISKGLSHFTTSIIICLSGALILFSSFYI